MSLSLSETKRLLVDVFPARIRDMMSDCLKTPMDDVFVSYEAFTVGYYIRAKGEDTGCFGVMDRDEFMSPAWDTEEDLFRHLWYVFTRAMKPDEKGPASSCFYGHDGRLCSHVCEVKGEEDKESNQ